MQSDNSGTFRDTSDSVGASSGSTGIKDRVDRDRGSSDVTSGTPNPPLSDNGGSIGVSGTGSSLSSIESNIVYYLIWVANQVANCQVGAFNCFNSFVDIVDIFCML